MIARLARVCLALLAEATLAGSPVFAAGTRIELPDFALQIRLDSSASDFLKAHQEGVGLSIWFADEIGPREVSLAALRREEAGSFTMRVVNVPFDPQQVERLRTLDYEVLVNVYSSHRQLDGNVLDCDSLQEPISHLQRRVHTLECRLGNWATRVRPLKLGKPVSPAQTSSTAPDSRVSPAPHSAASR